jgi:predicted O-methyltransferase YrrM
VFLRVFAERLPIRTILEAKSFRYWESRGFHISPVHYDQLRPTFAGAPPLPDMRTLKEELWTQRSELPGVRLNDDAQLELLSHFEATLKREYDQLPLTRAEVSGAHEYFINNLSFESVDGEMLYCFIRHFKPKRIIEIGSGYSTRMSVLAARRNAEEGHARADVIAYEPYPEEVLLRGFDGLTLRQTMAQDVPLSEFESLQANDILFIDSSHVLKIGSDVQYQYLEIIPRLRPGVIVHVHDIFLPAEYPRTWVMDQFRFWTEQYLLQAFLAFNDTFEVLWAGSYMHLTHPDRLEHAFRSYQRTMRWPGSFWMRRGLGGVADDPTTSGDSRRHA